MLGELRADVSGDSLLEVWKDEPGRRLCALAVTAGESVARERGGA
jgi:hypothetical protein